MDSILKFVFLIVIVFLSLWASYLQFFRVPDLVENLKAWEEAEPEIVEKVVPGPIDTVFVIKGGESREAPVDSTVIVNVEKEESQINEYKSYFGDQYLSGIVNSRVDGYLEDVRVEYFFKKDIVSTNQVSLREITVTRNVVQIKEVPSRGLDAGFMLGSTGDVTYFGPSLGIQTRSGNYFSYSYDALNGGHFLTYKRRISFPKISLF